MELKWFFLQPQFIIFTLIECTQNQILTFFKRNLQLNKGIIIPTEREDDDFVWNILIRKKRDDIYRTILNFKKFNDFLFVPHCKLDSIEDALNLITEDSYFA